MQGWINHMCNCTGALQVRGPTTTTTIKASFYHLLVYPISQLPLTGGFLERQVDCSMLRYWRAEVLYTIFAQGLYSLCPPLQLCFLAEEAILCARPIFRQEELSKLIQSFVGKDSVQLVTCRLKFLLIFELRSPVGGLTL